MTEKNIRSMKRADLLTLLEECGEQINTIKEKYNEVMQIREDLNTGGLLDRLRVAHDESRAKHEEIVRFYQEVFSGDDESESMQAGFENLVIQLEKTKKEMLGSPEEGVSGYIDEIKESLAKYKEKYDELYHEIETKLGPSATTLSLAINFNDKAEEYKKSRKIWEGWLIVLFIFAIIGFFAAPLNMDIPSDSKELIFYISRTFPLFGIFIWLAVFVGNRRAENRKLEEAYKHKEVMARSFEGYRRSIEDLDDEDKKLLIQLMRDLLDAMKKDSSDFLSTKGEGHPLGPGQSNGKGNDSKP